MANTTLPWIGNEPLDGAFPWDATDHDLDIPSNTNNMCSGGMKDSPLNNHFIFDDDGMSLDLKDISSNLRDIDIPNFLEELNATDVNEEAAYSDSRDVSAPCVVHGNDAATSSTHNGQDQHEKGAERRESEKGLVGIEEEDADGEDSSGTKRELRPQARNPKGGFITTWVDQDDTGNFDPSEEARLAYLRRTRLRLRQRAPTCQAKPHCKRDSVIEAIPEQLLVKLQFQSGTPEFTQLIRNLPSHPAPTTDPESTGYSLRKRTHSVAFTYNDNYDRKRKHFAPDIADDPTGHPFARGCWPCVSLGNDCPLLEDEFSWPCATCIEDDTECDLVVPPERKRACERCKSRRVGCSYSYTLNHGVACQQCMDSGAACLAGPAKDFIRTRVRCGRDWERNPLPVQKAPKIKDYSSCTDCTNARRACSFETDGNCGIGGVPCAECLETGDQCAVATLIPQHHTKTKRSDGVHNPTETSKENPAPEPPKPAEMLKASSTGKSKTIDTKLCHPIIFNHEDSTAGAEPCHFCEDAAYGILGLEKRRVEVIDWNNGRGLEEIGGGHRGDGVANTRMCPSCTLNRLEVIMCQGHQMERIPGSRVNKAEDDAALVDLLSGNSGRSWQWCALCPTRAIYRCRVPGDEGDRACGLVLCRQCSRALAGTHGGDLQVMLSKVRDEPSEHKPLGLRADYELLKEDGLLLRYVIYSNG